jgi:AhpD family alkylhydroperoxidase
VAIAANCEPCFKYHYQQAKKLGVSREDMLLAVKTAQSVKETAAKPMLELVHRYLDGSLPRRFWIGRPEFSSSPAKAERAKRRWPARRA